MDGYLQASQSGSTDPYGAPSPATHGVLRQIEEPQRTVDGYLMGCPCLCVPRIRWATEVPCTGGFFILGIGCK